MQVQFLVTVTMGRRDAQPLAEFKKEDGKSFIPYLKEKLENAMKGSYQFNALVDNVKVTKRQKVGK